MHLIEIQSSFHATHALRLPDGSLETPHAHDWHTTVTVSATQLDAIETVMDFHELESILTAALADLNQTDLNTHPHFATRNPSAERVAELIFNRIAPKLPANAKLQSVTVTEAPNCRATHLADD